MRCLQLEARSARMAFCSAATALCLLPPPLLPAPPSQGPRNSILQPLPVPRYLVCKKKFWPFSVTSVSYRFSKGVVHSRDSLSECVQMRDGKTPSNFSCPAWSVATACSRHSPCPGVCQTIFYPFSIISCSNRMCKNCIRVGSFS